MGFNIDEAINPHDPHVCSLGVLLLAVVAALLPVCTTNNLDYSIIRAGLRGSDVGATSSRVANVREGFPLVRAPYRVLMPFAFRQSNF